MGWVRPLEGSDDDVSPLERAKRLQAYARKVVALHKQGVYDPEQTATKRLKGAAEELGELSDDFESFSPRQRASLVRMSQSLRAYARKVGHMHDHGTGTRLGRLRLSPTPRMTDLPIEGWEADDDEELGFLPAILGAVGPLLGGLFGGGGGGSSSAPAPAAPAQAPIVMGGGDSNVNLPAIGGVVADQIRAVPPPIRQQVTDAVRESLDRFKSGQADTAALLKDLTAQLGPSLNKQLQEVNNAALQRQATYEHDSLNKSNQRWENNAEAQRRILARLDEMETKIGTAVVGSKQRRDAVAKAFGIPPKYQG